MSVLLFVVRLLELIEDGRRSDGGLPAYVVTELEMVLEGLEHDLSPRAAGVHCGICGQWYEWPGLLDAHDRVAHWQPPEQLEAAA